jgi:hypothetical protein
VNTQWLWNKTWEVRDDLHLDLISVGDTFTLKPESTPSPAFFTLQYTGKYPFWNGTIFYALGTKMPAVSFKHSWDDSVAANSQADGVQSEYEGVSSQLRAAGNDPYTERMQGHVMYKGHWAIIRLFCFSRVQPNGNDWFAIDSRYFEEHTEQDGTGHGDPP